MSFSRHMKIYRFDLFRWELHTKYNSRPDHRFDESSTGYSLTGCAPAVPVSASPVLDSFSLYIATVHQTAANDNLSLFSLSHQKGALHFVRAFSATFRDFSAMNLQLNPGNRLITNRRYSGI